MNALDLARLFQDSKADIDVISHSRGRLVARWWLERFDSRGGGRARAILVGSPLDDLAGQKVWRLDPDRIEATLAE